MFHLRAPKSLFTANDMNEDPELPHLIVGDGQSNNAHTSHQSEYGPEYGHGNCMWKLKQKVWSGIMSNIMRSS